MNRMDIAYLNQFAAIVEQLGEIKLCMNDVRN